MKTAIFTVIKNEHPYLEEWIKYHLELGITHLFIYEDSDSDSHRNITDKYPEVTLGNVLDIVDPEKKEYAIKQKEMKGSPQTRYMLDGLTHIASLKEYDWCFALDCDEYVTIAEDGRTLDDILSEFNDYDAILIQWKNYGANGLIYAPGYKEKGIIETYTKPCEMDADSKINLSKVCYNMRTYIKRNFLTNHQPSNVCKWCRTDFSEKRCVGTYEKLYLRHYITKSWEEYVRKIYIRGMFHKNHRGFRDFFILNPDMEKDREKLEGEILYKLFPNADNIKEIEKRRKR